jgi:hypothetical protein
MRLSSFLIPLFARRSSKILDDGTSIHKSSELNPSQKVNDIESITNVIK